MEALDDTVRELSAKFGSDMRSWLTPTRQHVFGPRNFLRIAQTPEDEKIVAGAGQNRGTEVHRVVFGAADQVSVCDVAPPGQSGYVDA